MKKKKLILRIIGISLILLFIITAIIISKKRDTISGFISAEKMKADYEYFWDFIYKGYPFTEVCERIGGDLKEIRHTGYKYLSDPMMQYGYYSFYYDLCRKITGNRYIGHLYPSDYFDYKICKPTIAQTSLREQETLIDNFYASMPKTGAFTNKKDMLYAGNFKNTNPPLMWTRKYSKPETKIINTGHIAYIKINSFFITEVEERREYLKMLEEFFIETADYNHSIIDIQDNGGGYRANYEAIIAPNIKKDVNIVYYGLYSENKYTAPYLEMFFKYHYKEIKKIEKHEISNVENSGTVKNDKAYILKEVIATSHLKGYKPCEDKKFWLLVSGDSYSAANRFPDIYNLPGKNALETCLEEIKKLGE